MSFTRLLAAGRSVIGIRKQPGPYRMNEEHLLPKFPPAERTVLLGESAESSAATEAAVRSAEQPPLERTAAGAGDASGSAAPGKPKPVRSWLARLRNPFQRITQGTAPARARAAKSGRQLVQGELALNTVRVKRNDLSDCDGEACDSRIEVGAQQRGRAQPMGIVWNRLSARLLRQAVQEFNVVQKERGKFLSQAGSGGGGAGST
jgi:hypothetical protein